jgi:hypothetical protein
VFETNQHVKLATMNTQFNTIETISNDSTISNKCEAYINACDQFEQQSLQFVKNENYVARMSCKEVSLAFDKAKKISGEYNIYAAAHTCEKWLEKAWNNAD